MKLKTERQEHMQEVLSWAKGVNQDDLNDADADTSSAGLQASLHGYLIHCRRLGVLDDSADDQDAKTAKFSLMIRSALDLAAWLEHGDFVCDYDQALLKAFERFAIFSKAIYSPWVPKVGSGCLGT